MGTRVNYTNVVKVLLNWPQVTVHKCTHTKATTYSTVSGKSKF